MVVTLGATNTSGANLTLLVDQLEDDVSLPVHFSVLQAIYNEFLCPPVH